MIVIKCGCVLRKNDYDSVLNDLYDQAQNGIILLPPGFDLVGASTPFKILGINEKQELEIKLLAPIKGE